MSLELSEEQVMLQEALRRFLEESLPLARLQREAIAPAGFDAALWQGLADLGVPGLLVPAAHGGSGLGLLDAAVAAEQMGMAAAPLPFAGAVVMAPRALVLAGSPTQQAEWLPRIASGSVRIAVGFASALTGQTGAGSVQLVGERLSARIDALAEADGATHFLLYLVDGRAALVEAAAARVELHGSVDPLRRVGHVVIDGASAQVLGGGTPAAAATAPRVLDAGRLAVACESLGAAQAMLDKSVAYAKERTQFGRPIGSFQGVKYMCADMVTQLEPCRSLVWHAAQLQDEGAEEAHLMTLQAKAHVGDVARDVSRMGIEVHGGVGFTDMLGLPFWFRRIVLDRQRLGGPDRCRLEAARVQGWKK